jgi:hypothetical protein
MRNPFLRAIPAALLLCCLTIFAQEKEQKTAPDKGMWRAISSNAQSITGDIALSDQKLSINFTTFTMVRIRALQPAELSALFDADRSAAGAGSLYRTNIPAARKFLHKNSLCGSDDTEWMATYAAGHSLQLAFFSSQTPPVLTLEALPNSTDLCGTYSYAR